MTAMINPRVSSGVRVGYWRPGSKDGPFQCVGYYTGPLITDTIPGKKFRQVLLEGELEFKVGVLFRPDLGKNHRLEPILILLKYVPEMWDYETWEQDLD
jgi:hypothetical protein